MDDTEMLDSAVCGFVRDAAKHITGGNCAFIDDDISILTHLAQRAVDAGLTDELSESIRSDIKKKQKEAY
jgi:hypothetical protein